MGQEGSKTGGAGLQGTNYCYICRAPTIVTAKNGQCYKCKKCVCKNCSKKIVPAGGAGKLTICEQCGEPQINISMPKKAEKVISLKPGDNKLPTDWKTLLDMPLQKASGRKIFIS